MKKKMLLLAVGFSFVFGMIIYLSNVGAIFAQECRVVRIIGMAIHNDIRIAEPNKTLSISKGDCVVWFNRESGPNLQIVFAEGKQCASVTDAPMGFKMDYGGCYVSSWIPVGGTSSLRFKEKGSFKYTIETVSGGPETMNQRGMKVAEGTIVVE